MIYFLKSKDEVYNRFREFKGQIEIAIGKKIKTLRYDNGGEYISNELISLCKDARIKRELIVPYNLEQNGFIERKNNFFLEATRAMIHDQDLPNFI